MLAVNVLGSGDRAAVVVRLRNLADRVLTDLPVTVGVPHRMA